MRSRNVVYIGLYSERGLRLGLGARVLLNQVLWDRLGFCQGQLRVISDPGKCLPCGSWRGFYLLKFVS